jgi:hypothetical protein
LFRCDSHPGRDQIDLVHAARRAARQVSLLTFYLVLRESARRISEWVVVSRRFFEAKSSGL